MLKKLLKYEFKATGRTFGGLYLGIAAAAVLLGIMMHFTFPGEAMFNVETKQVSGAAQIMAVILMIVYMGLLVAAIVLTAVTIVTRFRKNLLGGEGYLMQTLPVSSEALIASKLIAGAVWSVATALVSFLSSLLVMLICVPGGMVSALFGEKGLASLMECIRVGFGMSPALVFLGMAIASLCVTGCSILCVYAACMVGHQFKKYAVPAAIVSFFALNALQSFVCNVLRLNYYMPLHIDITKQPQGGSFTTALSQAPLGAAFWQNVACAAVPCLVFGALYFLLADWLMKKRLNLE
jgi:hypothetical protein